jgi:hypothetical protein
MNFFPATANSFFPLPSLREAMPLSFSRLLGKEFGKGEGQA